MAEEFIKFCHCTSFEKCWGGLDGFLNCRSKNKQPPAEPPGGESLKDLFSFMNRRENEEES